MPAQTSKDKNAAALRSKKFVHSEPVPPENDSDSDFNPGSFDDKAPKKSEGKSTSQAAVRLKAGKRRKGMHDEAGYAPRGKVRRRVTSRSQHNPLQEYFNDLGLQSASEDEQEAEHEADNEEDSDDGIRSDEDPNQEEGPVALRTLTALIKSSSPTVSGKQGGGGADRHIITSTTESETEPETDIEVQPPPVSTFPSLKRKSSAPGAAAAVAPSKRAKLEKPDESVTESESELDVTSARPVRSIPPCSIQPRVTPDSGSETESDPEAEELASKHLQPRPAFPLKPDQPTLGPLILDHSHSVSGRINTFLREYQRDGVKFFWERYKNGQGGILGDDMGLVSKTIQVISFLSAIMQKHGDRRDLNRRRTHVSALQDASPEWKEQRMLPPANKTWPTCLIIAPSSVVGNWEREFETWGYFEVGMYTGLPKERIKVLTDFKMGRLDVVLTSFETARKDIALIDDLPWSCIIVDEVHRVKNPRSGLALAFNEFACTTRFGLTGTAIQNSLMEFWTILDWTNPESVGTKRQWDGYVSRPLMIGQSKSATQEQRTRAMHVAQILTEKLLPKFFLRRTKQIIKEQLPEKDDHVVFCPMTPKQIEVYKRILAMEPVQNMILKDEQCDCGSGKKRNKCCHPFDRGDLFRYLTTLIKISNHLALILPSPSDTAEQTARHRELSRVAFETESIPKYGPAMLVPRFCGKWMVLEGLLNDWRKDPSNKVLIFTKSVKLLEMLEFHLRLRNLGFVKLDGSTKPQDRMPLIDKFHEDPEIVVFLISTLAGGTGLNLTGANKVVIFDPNWNPAHDLQAIDRAYRFGQTRDVSVFRLLGAGSVEELIYARQVYKQQQMQVGYSASFQTRYFEGVQGEKNKQGELFGIKNIFSLREDTLATKQAVERAVLSDFNWALANLDAKKRKTNGKLGQDAEITHNKDIGNLNGLDSLLFDDRIPEVQDKSDSILKILNDVGVQYTHRNEDLIAESAIEGRKFQKTLEVTKKERKERKKKAKDTSEGIGALGEQWPPVRRHHKPKPTAEERLRSRQMSMIELGHITSPEQLHVFVEQKFMKWSIERQQQFVAELDAHHSTRNSVQSR